MDTLIGYLRPGFLSQSRTRSNPPYLHSQRISQVHKRPLLSSVGKRLALDVAFSHCRKERSDAQTERSSEPNPGHTLSPEVDGVRGGRLRTLVDKKPNVKGYLHT